MADRHFLQHLDYIRSTYKPKRMATTPVILNEMEFNLKEIGRRMNDLKPGSRPVMDCLDFVCRRSLDLIAHPDYDELFELIIDLHTRKNAGYAGLECTDPWANFRTSQWFNISPFAGCMVRMGDKFIRVTNLAKNPKSDQVNENIKDTLYDLAIYSIIARCLREEERSAIICDGGIFG